MRWEEKENNQIGCPRERLVRILALTWPNENKRQVGAGSNKVNPGEFSQGGGNSLG